MIHTSLPEVHHLLLEVYFSHLWAILVTSGVLLVTSDTYLVTKVTFLVTNNTFVLHSQTLMIYGSITIVTNGIFDKYHWYFFTSQVYIIFCLLSLYTYITHTRILKNETTQLTKSFQSNTMNTENESSHVR